MSDTPKKKHLPRYRGYARLIKTGVSGSLSVPSELMSVLTDGLLFKPELTKDGILFKIVDETRMITDDKAVPAWVKSVTKPKRTTTTGDAEPEPDNIEDDEEQETDDGPEVDTETDDDEPPTDDDDSPF